MIRALRGAVLCVAALLALGACTPDSGDGSIDFTPGEVDVDVDNAELRKLKQEAGIEDCEPTTAAPADGGLPDLALPCLGGGPEVNLASLRGPMVVNFLASWCGPCRRELPYYQEFHAKHGEQVAVLGVDYDDVQPAAALQLASETGATFPLVADPGAELGEHGLAIQGLPGIAFVDEEGRLAFLTSEEIDSLAELESLVEEHLGVTL